MARPRSTTAPAICDQVGTAYNNRFLFTGREYAATYRGIYNVPAFNFYEYRARAYNPQLGRFMSEDPKLFDAGDYNLFRYCHNDPEDLTDPMGLDPENYGYRPDRAWDIAKWADRSNNLQITFANFMKSRGSQSDADAKGGFGKGNSDPQLRAIGRAIEKLQGGVARYAEQFPQYPNGQVVVDGLRKAYKEGNIQLGDPKMFTGKDNPFVTLKGVVYFNAQSFQHRNEVNAPRLAHDGEHLVDTRHDGQFARERRAYNVQHGFSVVVGPYQRRLSDAEIMEIIHQNP